MIQIRTIIEIAGFPKEHVEETMFKVIKNLKDNKNLKILKTSVAPVEEIKTMWSSFVELDAELPDFKELLNFCFDFTPSSIEILKPEKIEDNSEVFADFLNDLLARLHQYTAAVVNLNTQNKLLKKRLGEDQEEK